MCLSNCVYRKKLIWHVFAPKYHFKHTCFEAYIRYILAWCGRAFQMNNPLRPLVFIPFVSLPPVTALFLACHRYHLRFLSSSLAHFLPGTALGFPTSAFQSCCFVSAGRKLIASHFSECSPPGYKISPHLSPPGAAVVLAV